MLVETVVIAALFDEGPRHNNILLEPLTPVRVQAGPWL